MYKICVDCRMIEHSGLGTYLKNIVPRLMENEREIEFFLLGDEEKIRRYVNDNLTNYTIIQVNSRIFSIAEQFELLKKIPKKIDLMWSPHFNIPILYRGKMLVTIHDVFHLSMSEYAGGFHKYLYAKFLYYMIKKKAKKILCVSNFTKSEIIRLIGINKEVIYPIYLGVDKSWFNVNKDSDSPHHKPYLLFVGNVKPNKNLITLIKAFNLIKNEIPHDLVIVGKKDGLVTPAKNLEEEYSKSKDRIIFTGFVEESLLRQYYLYADIFVFPSRYEGFGFPLLEAMAANCAVISSNAASLPEVGGESVMYFDPMSEMDLAEKIKLLINDSTLKRALIQKGKEHSRNFVWNKSAEKTLEVIKSLLVRL